VTQAEKKGEYQPPPGIPDDDPGALPLANRPANEGASSLREPFRAGICGGGKGLPPPPSDSAAFLIANSRTREIPSPPTSAPHPRRPRRPDRYAATVSARAKLTAFSSTPLPSPKEFLLFSLVGMSAASKRKLAAGNIPHRGNQSELRAHNQAGIGGWRLR